MALTKVSYSMITGAPANVKDFGAVGDGATDDTAAIQAAINYAVANNAWLELSSGSYFVSAALEIDTTSADPGVFKLYGSGSIVVAGGNIPAFDYAANGGVIKITTPDSDSYNLFIDGVRFYKPDTSYPTRYSTFVNMTAQRNVHVMDCVFDGGYEVGVYAEAMYGCSIQNCSFTGFDTAIYLYRGCNTMTIFNNSIRNGRQGIYVKTVDNADVNVNISITDNYIESITNLGIDCQGIRASTFAFNYFESVDQSGTGRAIVLSDAASPGTETSARNTFLSNYGNSLIIDFAENTGNNLYIGNVGFTLTDPNGLTWVFDTSGNIVASSITADSATLGQDSPVAATLINSWANTNASYYGAARYWRDPFGNVHLEGNIGGGVLNTVAFTLPVGYRPEFEMGVPTSSNDAFGQIRISPTGDVYPRIGSTTAVNLNGITFRANGY